MTDLERTEAVNRRLRKDLKRAIRVARYWKEIYHSLCFCYDPSHRNSVVCPNRSERKPGHALRVKR